MDRKARVRLLKAGVWVLGLTPIAWVVYRFFYVDGLTANPIQEAEHWSGLTALVALTCAIAVTPLRRWTGFNDLQKLRRLIGLFGFFYLTVHFSIWLGLDQLPLDWGYVLEDLTERPFIVIGFTAWLMLIPLAVTSTRGWIRRMGKNWVRLHRLVYLVVPMGVVHYFWATKADDRGPTIVAVIVAILLGARVYWAFQKKKARAATRPRSKVPIEA